MRDTEQKKKKRQNKTKKQIIPIIIMPRKFRISNS